MRAADCQPNRPCYEILVEGQLDAHWESWFEGLALEAQANGLTRISGPISDQAALRGVLERIFDLNLKLVLLARREPLESIEDLQP